MLWSEFRAQVRRTLDDAGATSVTWEDETLLDYLNAALRRFAVHTALEKTWSYEASETVTEVTLPEDVIALGPVWFPNRVLLTPISIRPGDRFIGTTVTTTTLPRGYYRWPSAVLNLTQALGSSKTLTVYYWAYYPTIVEDTDPVLVPGWAVEAMEWYSVYRAMARPAVTAAVIGQYDTRQDAGNPEHNPLEKFSEFAFKQFQRVLHEFPPQDRSGWDQVLT